MEENTQPNTSISNENASNPANFGSSNSNSGIAPQAPISSNPIPGTPVSDKPISHKSYKKIFITIGIVLLIIVALVIVLVVITNPDSASTSTVKSYDLRDRDYTASDTLSCTLTQQDKEQGFTSKTNIETLFNYVHADDKGRSAYQYVTKNKIAMTFEHTITDEQYKKITDSSEVSKCTYDDKCRDSHLELGVSKYGYETIIDRKDNVVEISYVNLYGAKFSDDGSEDVDKETVQQFKQKYEEEGFTCTLR